LIFELAAAFLGVPLLINQRVLPNWPIPFLLLMTLGAFLILRQEPAFDGMSLVRFQGVLPRIGPLLLRDVLLIVLLGIAVWWTEPELLFSFVKRNPVLWGAVMVLYPVFSVYPQELLFRAYFFRRYAPLFGEGWGMIAASALAFGFVHIIFGNWLSVALSAAGGLLFALTYRESGSLMLACIEHALFGDFVFTLGIGQFFFHGVLR
jgi:membrane protease YdiL (CAAX protease family)